MRSIGVISEKGGTAKTTTALNLAVGLAKEGQRVLLVDTDPSGNASLVLLMGRPPAAPTIANVLLGDAEASAAIRGTGIRRLDVLPADASLADASLALASMIGRENRLRAALAGVLEEYDFLIVDTSPTRSVLTINALTTVAEVLVPVEPGLFSLAGLGTLQRAVEDVRHYLDNTELRIMGLVLTRTRHDAVSRDTEAQLREMFGPLVLTTTIPNNVKVEEAHSRYQSVLDYAPQAAGARAYSQLVTEVLTHGGEESRAGTAAEWLAAADHDTAAA
jgi:chromosome partitioning protein